MTTKREPRTFKTRTEVQRALVNEPGLQVVSGGGNKFICDPCRGIIWDDDTKAIAMLEDAAGPWTEVLTPRRWGPWEEVERFEDADDAGTVEGLKYRACVSEWETGEWNTTYRASARLPEYIHWVRRWRL